MTLNTCKNCGSYNIARYAKLMPRIFGNVSYEINLCKSCGIGTTFPEPVTTIEHYISADRPEIISSSVKEMAKRGVMKMIEEYKRIRGVFPESLLDVGCGNGLCLQAAKELGLLTHGIEPSSAMCKRAREKGVEVTQCELDNYTEYDRFDLVVLNSVIEHLPEPKYVFQILSERIGGSAVLCFQQAVFDGLLPKLLKSTWYGWAPAEHYWHFSAKSFEAFISQHGLKVIRKSRSNLYYQAISLGDLRYWKSFLFSNGQKGLSLVATLLNRGDSVNFYAIKAPT